MNEALPSRRKNELIQNENSTKNNRLKTSSVNDFDGRMRTAEQRAGSERSGLRTLPASQYKVHSIAADGDCFFRSFETARTGYNDTANNESVLQLRNEIASYFQKNSDVISNHPAFEQVGMQELHELLLTSGHWNGSAGDLIPILTAQATGREIHILQPNDGSDNFYHELQVIPAHNPDLPKNDLNSSNRTDSAPIYILKQDDHYSLLEEKNREQTPASLATPENTLIDNRSKEVQESSDLDAMIDSLHDEFSPSEEEITNKITQSLQNNKSASHSSNVSLDPAEGVIRPRSYDIQDKYQSFIEKKILGYNGYFEHASSEKLIQAHREIENIIDQYNQATVQLDAGKSRRVKINKDSLSEARKIKHEIENSLGDNIERRLGFEFRKGRKVAYESLTSIRHSIEMELNHRDLMHLL